MQYLRDHFDELDAWAMCELHVAADRAEAVSQAFLKDGWKARIAPGQRSQAWQQAGRGAATAGPGQRRCQDAVEGGVGLGVKKHLSTTWVPSSLIEGMEDIEAAVLHLKGLKLLVVSLYLRPGGLLRSGRNAARLHDLAFLTEQLQLPWIACADWNATPGELKEAGWLDTLRAEVHQPEGVELTCTAGMGRILDYALAGRGASRLVRSYREAEGTPWKAHRCGVIDIACKPPVLQGWKLHMPAPLPGRLKPQAAGDGNSKAARARARRIEQTRAGKTEEQRRMAEQEAQINGQPETAERARGEAREARGEARSMHPLSVSKRGKCWQGRWPGTVADLSWRMAGVSCLNSNDVPAAHLGWNECEVLEKDAARSLDGAWAGWLDQVETYYLAEAGINPLAEGAKYCGRARGPQIIWGRADRPRCRGLDWCCPRARWWSGIAAELSLQMALRRNHRGSQQLATSVGALRRLVASAPEPWWEGAMAPPSDLAANWPCMDERGDEEHVIHTVSRERFCRLAGRVDVVTDDLLRRLRELAVWAEGAAISSERVKSQKDFGKWVQESAKSGAGLLFRRVRSEARGEELEYHGLDEGPTAEPTAFMEHIYDRWATLWKQKGYLDPAEEERYEQEMDSLRNTTRELQRAWGDSLGDLETWQLERAVAKARQSTGKGVDQLGPKDIADLPTQAKEELLRLYRECERKWTWPSLLCINRCHLKPKPAGGHRSIASAPYLVRLWGLTRAAPTDEWIQERATFWDQAVAGSSALQTAFVRCLRDEAATALGVTVVKGLIDIKGFYDHIDLGRLVAYAVDWGFPPQVLVMSLVTDLGPRILELGGWVPRRTCSPRRSALTGERHGNHKARLLLYSTLEAMHWAVPHLRMGQWVDDLHLAAVGTAGGAAADMKKAATMLARRLAEDRLIMADNTVVLLNVPGLAGRLVRDLAAAGVRVKAATTGVDLGIDTACGSARARRKHESRKREAKLRSTRVAVIGRVGTKGHPARRIWRASCCSKARYAIPCIGATLSELESMRTAYGSLVDRGPRGRCLTTALALSEGRPFDPMADVMGKLAAQWCRAWVEEASLHSMVRRAWPRILKEVTGRKSDQRWRAVVGPASAAIHMMNELGWDTPAPDRWVGPGGDEWMCKGGCGALTRGDERDFVNRVEQTVWDYHWAKAAGGRHGAGITANMDLGYIRREIRRLRNAGQPDMAAMVRTVATGGTWCKQRRIEAGYLAEPRCCRCGAANEDDWHAIYKCPDNDRWPEGRDSADLVERGLREGPEKPCFWLRGLIPDSDRPRHPAPHDDGWRSHGLVEGIFKPRQQDDGWVVIAGDASGGPFASRPRYRRVGVGLAQVGWNEPTLLAWAAFNLVGERQEVGDGEELALLAALQHTDDRLLFITDRESVWDMFYRRVWKGPMRTIANPHNWRDIGHILECRAGRVHVVKIESHLTDRDLDLGYGSRFLAAANAHADRIAGEAASRVAVPAGIVEASDALEELARRVLRRAARAALAAAAAGKHEGKAKRIAKYGYQTPTARAIAASGHKLCDLAGTGVLQCAACMQRLPAAGVIGWLRAHPCVMSEVAAETVGPYQATVAGAHIHHSHRLAWSEETLYWFCLGCGGTAALAMRKLRRPCCHRPGVEGRRALGRLAKGLPPWGAKRPDGPLGRLLNHLGRRTTAAPLTAEQAARHRGRCARRAAAARGRCTTAGEAGAKRRRLPAATPAEEDGAVRDSGRTVTCGDAADHRADQTERKDAFVGLAVVVRQGAGVQDTTEEALERAWAAGLVAARRKRQAAELADLSSGAARSDNDGAARLAALLARVRRRVSAEVAPGSGLAAG